jgi:hypothetical protein
VVGRRGRRKTVCVRGAYRAASRGRSSSPLAAMDTPARTVDSLRYLELRMLLEEGGIPLSDDQLARLAPYLVPPRVVRAVAAQLRTEASVFARHKSTALAFDHAFAKLVVGRADGESVLQDVERYSSPELAIRTFLSGAEGPHGS